jgi:hypothetical protein
MGGDEFVELRQDRVVPTGGEVGVDPVLERAQAQLLQPGNGGGRELGGRRVGERRPTPQPSASRSVRPAWRGSRASSSRPVAARDWKRTASTASGSSASR